MTRLRPTQLLARRPFKLFLPSTCCYKLLCANAKPTFNDLDLSFTWEFFFRFRYSFCHSLHIFVYEVKY